LQQGELWIEDQANKGNVFAFSLPVAQAEQSAIDKGGTV